MHRLNEIDRPRLAHLHYSALRHREQLEALELAVCETLGIDDDNSYEAETAKEIITHARQPGDVLNQLSSLSGARNQ